MEQTTTWKGHTFTLFVFGGIVVLCSIFFILGMLVGRAQGQKLAGAAADVPAKTEPKPEIKDGDSIAGGIKNSQTIDSDVGAFDTPKLPAPPRDVKKERVPEPPVLTPAPVPANTWNFQVAALRKAKDADKLVRELRKKGFKGYILQPADDDTNPFFRVMVGPFLENVEAQPIKKKLESEGYKPILKK